MRVRGQVCTYIIQNLCFYQGIRSFKKVCLLLSMHRDPVLHTQMKTTNDMSRDESMKGQFVWKRVRKTCTEIDSECC